jgi:hypothetical protein
MLTRVLKLRTECVDDATGLTGTLTHWIYGMDGRIEYLFQPKGLDDDGQPIKRLGVCKERLKVKDSDFEEVDIPVEILGSQVANKATGFNGTAVEFVRHLNGCFHVVIQPKGTLPGKKKPIDRCEFDLRECDGKKIKEMSEAELKKSTDERPSPTGNTSRPDRLLSLR